MNVTASGIGLNADTLKERNVPVQAQTQDQARQAVIELNAQEERSNKEEHKRRTYGRTPDGIGV